MPGIFRMAERGGRIRVPSAGRHVHPRAADHWHHPDARPAHFKRRRRTVRGDPRHQDRSVGVDVHSGPGPPSTDRSPGCLPADSRIDPADVARPLTSGDRVQRHRYRSASSSSCCQTSSRCSSRYRYSRGTQSARRLNRGCSLHPRSLHPEIDQADALAEIRRRFREHPQILARGATFALRMPIFPLANLDASTLNNTAYSANGYS